MDENVDKSVRFNNWDSVSTIFVTDHEMKEQFSVNYTFCLRLILFVSYLKS